MPPVSALAVPASGRLDRLTDRRRPMTSASGRGSDRQVSRRPLPHPCRRSYPKAPSEAGGLNRRYAANPPRVTAARGKPAPSLLSRSAVHGASRPVAIPLIDSMPIVGPGRPTPRKWGSGCSLVLGSSRVDRDDASRPALPLWLLWVWWLALAKQSPFIRRESRPVARRVPPGGFSVG